MLRTISALLVLVRILLVWIAFMGMGRFLTRFISALEQWKLPSVPVGLLFYLLLSFLLSLLHLLTPSVLTGFLILGLLMTVFHARKPVLRINEKWNIVTIIIGLLAIFLVTTNFLRAIRPNIHSDPLITYSVQPDRWLTEGNIHFLDETKYSLSPLIGETLSLWPAALASDRTDRLSLLQCFQMSMLFASLLYVWFRTSKQKNIRTLSLVLCAGMAASKLAGWGALAKIDMTLTFFVTIALTEAYIGSKKPVIFMGFLFMGLAAATKHTAWLILPTFLLITRRSFSGFKKRDYMIAAALLLLFPVAYAARTYIHSGMLMFPNRIPFFKGSEFWQTISVPSLSVLENYPVQGVLDNVGYLFLAWSVPVMMFFLGSLEKARKENLPKFAELWIPIFPYVLLCVLVFNPLQWGSKYTIMIICPSSLELELL